ncbi:MAG: hypothetical protein ACQEWG_01170 [Bacteroidota bacterium]
MKPKSPVFLLILMLITACSQVGSNARESMFQNKSFVHLYFETEKECMDAQPDPDYFHNCHQQIDFMKDRRVRIMLTDILWDGTYKIQGDLLILKFEPNFEIPTGEIFFEILNPTRLIKTDDNNLWKKMNGNSIWK